MACAIYSLVTGRRPANRLAMTGELTLSGLVMPIGGVKEKVIAAKRVKVTRVILPKENEADIDDIPQDVQDMLTFHLVEELGEALAARESEGTP